MLPYKVKVKYAKGAPVEAAQFKQREEALKYIQDRLAQDKLMRVETIYQLWELGELEQSFDQSDAGSASGSGSATGGSTGASTSENFRPSPLQTTPRPPGTPANYWKDEPNEEDKKK